MLTRTGTILGSSRITTIGLNVLNSLRVISAIIRLLRTRPRLPIIYSPILHTNNNKHLNGSRINCTVHRHLLPLTVVTAPGLPRTQVLTRLPSNDTSRYTRGLLPFIGRLLVANKRNSRRRMRGHLCDHSNRHRAFAYRHLPNDCRKSKYALTDTLTNHLTRNRRLTDTIGSTLSCA